VSAAPDVYVGPAFVGWRSWRILPFERLGEPSSVRLCASGTRGIPKVWEPGQATRALCGKFSTTHEAPSPGCECGVHAYRTRERAEAHLESFREGNGADVLGWAFGRVSLWGRVVECEHGWRAEYAYPYAVEVHADPNVADAVLRLYGIDVERLESFPAPEVRADEEDEDEPVNKNVASLIKQLDAISKSLHGIHDGLLVAVRNGQINDRARLNLAISHYWLRISNVQSRLRRCGSLAELQPATAVELEKLTAELQALAGHIETIDARIREPARTVKTSRIPDAPRLNLDDDAIVAAVAESARQWREYRKTLGQNEEEISRNCHVSAHCVGCVLIDQPVADAREMVPSHSDVIRIGQRLGKLARAGRVNLVSRPHESRYYMPIDDAT
jgi:hypothetical protein